MKKTSVYLSDEDRERLREIAEREGRSQASVLREAIAAYGDRRPDELTTIPGVAYPPGLTTIWKEDEFGTFRIDLRPDGTRYFPMDGAWEGDGTSAADIPEEEYLKGFGE
jgi:hypothetical protein